MPVRDVQPVPPRAFGVADSGLLDLLAERVRAVSNGTSLDRGKMHVVIADALISALVSDGTPAARTADALAEAAPAGRATALGSGRRVELTTAILANSLRIHALLQDDAHPATMLHPGAVVLPVALGLAEEMDVSSARLVGAVAAGYEAMAVLGAPVATRTASLGFRNTTLFGGAGAAVAAALMLDLDDQRLKAAILIACGLSGGTLAPLTLGSPDWRTQPGLAALSGLAATRYAAALDSTLLAQMRFDAIETPGGLYATLTASEVDWLAAVDSTAYPAMHHISHKQHATCGANQVPVAALSHLLGGLDAGFADIVRVEVALTHTALAYPGTEDFGPFTGDGVYMSRPLALAAIALHGGGPLTRSVLDRALEDDRLEEALGRISSRAVDAAEGHPQAATVTLELRDGRVLSAGMEEIDTATLEPTLDELLSRLEGFVREDEIRRFADAVRRLPAGVPVELVSPLISRTEVRA